MEQNDLRYLVKLAGKILFVTTYPEHINDAVGFLARYLPSANDAGGRRHGHIQTKRNSKRRGWAG